MNPFPVQSENYISISFQIGWDMIVVTVFHSIMNQMEFHLVQNRKENGHHDHIPINLKGNANVVFSVCIYACINMCGTIPGRGVRSHFRSACCKVHRGACREGISGSWLLSASRICTRICTERPLSQFCSEFND